MNKQQKRALDDLKKVASRTEDFIKSASGSAEHLSGKNSSVLYGLVGSLIGTLLAVVLDASFPMMQVVENMIAAGSLSGLGAVLGILVYRGRNRIKLEQLKEENRILYDEMLDRINSLPKSAPKELKEKYYKELEEINSKLTNHGNRLLEPKSFKAQDLYFIENGSSDSEVRQLKQTL